MTLVTTLLITFAVMLSVIAAMAVGVMNGRKPISGSCGGVSGKGCQLCGSGQCKKEGDE